MSISRKKILDSLSTKRKKTTVPSSWSSQNDFSDLPTQFAQALQKVKGEVHRASDSEEAFQILKDVLDELNAQKIVVSGEEVCSQIESHSLTTGREWFIVGTTGGDLREFCANADVGVTGVDFALAETGSVILEMNARQSRLASLLPPAHIVILPVSKIVPDIFFWTANHKGDLPSQLVIISGPSKTADIEQTLVVGVHGPKRYIVILYNEE